MIGWATGRESLAGRPCRLHGYGRAFRACRCKPGIIADMYRVGYSFPVIEVRQTDAYETWYRKLRDRDAKSRILIRIRRLAAGNPGDVRPVGGGVSELRIDYGPGYRVYFLRVDRDLAVLLLGGDKSTQRQDIERARELAQELVRGGNS